MASVGGSVRSAACAIVVRRRPSRIEVLLVRRADRVAFLPGFSSFPGGSVDEADRGRAGVASDPEASARHAALRELFEETGFALLDPAAAPPDDLDEIRTAFVAGDAAEGLAMLDARGRRFSHESLEYAGRWITPAYAPIRFDTRFYLIDVGAGSGLPEPSLAGGELDRVEWITPSSALASWGRAEILIGPPAVVALRILSGLEAAPHDADLRDAARRMAEVRGANGRESHRFELLPGIFPIALRTPTLPPATHTNAYVVGSREAVLVEPATPHRDEQDRLVAWLDELREGGVEVESILATHHHPDHIGGAAVLRERLGLPLRAHPATVERLRGVVSFDGTMDEGDRLELDGPDPVTLRAVHTPGHAPGHLCFLEERSGALLAGDMIASVGTILVEAQDGDMELYLASLRRMIDLGPSLLCPAHGFAIRDPERRLSEYIEHRLMRERKVVEALREARARGACAASPVELLPIAYDDAPRSVWPLAAMSLEAHLLKLEREGKARRVGGGWAPS